MYNLEVCHHHLIPNHLQQLNYKTQRIRQHLDHHHQYQTSNLNFHLNHYILHYNRIRHLSYLQDCLHSHLHDHILNQNQHHHMEEMRILQHQNLKLNYLLHLILQGHLYIHLKQLNTLQLIMLLISLHQLE